MSFTLTKNQLLFDFYQSSFYDAKRRHKSKKHYVKEFEKDLHNNLLILCDDLWNRIYKPNPSTCFIIEYPKKKKKYLQLILEIE